MQSADLGPQDAIARSLRRLRRKARLAMLFERIWPAIWPALGAGGIFVVLALLDVPLLLPAWLQLAMLAGFVLAVAGLLVRGLRRVQRFDDHAADRRLEHASGLRHRPLAVLSERPASMGTGLEGAADMLWRAHIARAAAQIGRLRVGMPRPGLAARDRRGLRLGLVVALFAALVIAGPEAPGRILRSLVPAVPPGPGAPATVLQAWITPPSYTAIAPIFLHPDHSAVAVPAGSHLTVSLTGGYGMPNLVMSGQTEAFRPLDGDPAKAGSFQADKDLLAGGRLAVRRHGGELAGWDVAVIADTPPTAAFTEPPGRAARSLQTRLPWTVTDDYGVTGLQAEVRLHDRPEAPPIVIAIPLPSGALKQGHGTALHDLTASPWAGLPVTARLMARDATGQTGVSPDAGFEMPERRFQNPVARAVIAVRKQLALHPEDRMAAIQMLEQIAADPDQLANDDGAFLNLRSVAALLQWERDAGAIEEAQTRLWQLALHLEEGTTERTARALAQARQDVRDAMQRQAEAEKKGGEKPDPKEMDRLMQTLQRAIQQHLQALNEQAKRDHADPPYDRDGKPIDGKELDRMAQAMRDAERQGQEDMARGQMAELDRMLDALQNAHPERGGAQNAQRRQRGRQQMSALQDMVQREGGLLDHAQQRATPQGHPFNQPTDNGDNSTDAARPDGSPEDAQRQTEQRVQQALRRALGEMMQQFGDLTGQIPPSLGEADGAMRDAGQALGEGRDAAAAADQQHAIEALQKGGREMGQQMARMFGRQSGQGQSGQDGEDGEDQADSNGGGYGPDGSAFGDGRNGRPMANGEGRDPNRDGRRDPLGRLMQDGASGDDETDDVRVPDQMEQARTRAIQDELRRRGAERERPQEELQYIDRLLRQF